MTVQHLPRERGIPIHGKLPSRCCRYFDPAENAKQERICRSCLKNSKQSNPTKEVSAEMR